jgi:hypothetical protein
MKKFRCCCLLSPIAALAAAIVAAIVLLFFRFTVHIQVDAHSVGDTVTVFGRVEDSVSIPLVATAYLVNDGQDAVWVATARPLPQTGRHVLVRGQLKGGLKIPGKLGGGTLLKHLEETDRWDLPL